LNLKKNCVKTKTQNSEIEKRVLKPSPREHPNRYIYTHTYRYIVRIETRGSLKEEGLDNTGLNVPLLATTKQPQFLWITLYSSFQFHHQTSSFWVTFVPSLFFFCVSSSVQTRLMSAQSKQCFFLSYKYAKVTTKSQLCTKWCEKLENYENGAGPWTLPLRRNSSLIGFRVSLCLIMIKFLLATKSVPFVGGTKWCEKSTLIVEECVQTILFFNFSDGPLRLALNQKHIHTMYSPKIKDYLAFPLV